MRIAMITVHECPLASSEGKERGGINVYTYELSKALATRGIAVDAYTRVQDTHNERIVDVLPNFRVIHVPSGPPVPLSKRDIFLNLHEFADGVNAHSARGKIRYDAVHAHYYLSGLVAERMNAVTRGHAKFVMTYHTLGLIKQLISHSYVSEDPPERVRAERELMHRADTVITSSDAGKEYLTGLYDGPAEKISVIPPGVDTSLFVPMDLAAARTGLGLSVHRKIVLAVGRIDPVKGFDVLLAAIKMLSGKNPALARDLCVVIVGGDVGQSGTVWNHEMQKLESLRRIYGLTSSVKFIPAQPQEKLPLYYNAADVLVMPSHYESFGMVAMEALSCAVPVIATDVTGISSVIREVPQGHIVSANNPIGLAERIGHVLTDHDGIRTRARGMKSFDWSVIAQRMESAYRTPNR